jgi:hypothetical protein
LVISMHHSGDLTIQNERFHHPNLQTGAFTYLSIYLSILSIYLYIYYMKTGDFNT